MFTFYCVTSYFRYQFDTLLNDQKQTNIETIVASDQSLSAGGGADGFHAAASLAFSAESSTAAARDAQSKVSGSLLVSQVILFHNIQITYYDLISESILLICSSQVLCYTSRVQISDFTALHVSFRQGLVAANFAYHNESDSSLMADLIAKYGSFYYQSANIF